MSLWSNFFGGGDSERSSGSSSSALNAEAKKVFNKGFSSAEGIAKQGFKPYDWRQRVAGYNPDQASGFGMTRNWAGSEAAPSWGEATGMFRNYANAGPSWNERIVDEGGRLGSIDSYMNPYIGRVVDNAARTMGEAGQRQRNDIGAGAKMAGAFGDARHGIVEGEQMLGETRAVGEMADQGYASAFNAAMGMRGDDAGRFYTADEAALGRQYQGGEALLGADAARDKMIQDRIAALISTGTFQQQHDQNISDARYEEQKAADEWRFRELDMWKSLMSGTPSTTTTTTKQPNNTLATLIGAGASAFG